MSHTSPEQMLAEMYRDRDHNPWRAYAWFLRHRPVYRASGSDVFYVFGMEDQRQLLTDSRVGVTHPFRISQQVLGRTLLDMDGAHHRELRACFGPLFNGENLQRFLRAVISKRVAELVSQRAGHSVLDAVSDLAQRLPLQIICDFLDLQEHQLPWLEQRLELLMRHLETSAEPFERVDCYRNELIAAVQASQVEAGVDSSRSDSQFSRIDSLAAKVSVADRVALGMLALAAGVETSVCTIANTFYCLLAHPHVVALVQQRPETLQAVIRECLRWQPAQHDTVRFAREALVVAGVEVPAGATLRLMLASANRDPSVYADPDVFDPQRAETLQLTFGLGSHACLGRALATLTLTSLVQKVLEQTDRLELGDERSAIRFVGRTFRRPQALPMRVRMRRSAAPS